MIDRQMLLGRVRRQWLFGITPAVGGAAVTEPAALIQAYGPEPALGGLLAAMLVQVWAMWPVVRP